MNINEINNKNQFSFSCIYLWTNLINGKVYVGQAQNFYNRMKCYLRGGESNRLIGIALDKYGFNNFDISVIEKVAVCDLDKREQYWMDYYKSYDRDNGYNLCKEAGTIRGYHHTEEDKKRMSEIRKDYFVKNPNSLSGENNPNYGKKASEQTKKKMSESRIGNQNAKGKHWKLSDEFCENRRKNMLGKKFMLGKKHSDETKRKISESNSRRVYSEETLKKMSESHKGKTCKKVLCVETNIIYNSIGEAAACVGKDRSSISKCCRNKQKSVAGYTWKYVDD